ncbi:DUF4158 domain-containing protein [Nonomuraea sp. FMUSA5-5]|uniref:DUF4158 domain-containing protein n=1 Tax=Nonomuraea composti TaxID=2720023 RepID=A0ABX1BSJ7_9ACTN|nr:DUF4158 domain-containing protein [Nonomuraea sp. FMUSA5-5]
MLGTFLTDSGPADVPRVVVEYVAEPLGISDVSVAKSYGDRPQTPYEHASKIGTMLCYRELSAAEEKVATFITSRVRKSRDSRRELFDRAVLWLIINRVLLPGITTLSQLDTEVRRAELEATLQVPDGRKVSTLEWMRTAVTRLSGTGTEQALDRTSYVLGLGTGRWTAPGGAGEAGRAAARDGAGRRSATSGPCRRVPPWPAIVRARWSGEC